MAEPTATAFNPLTGQVEEYDREALPRAGEAVGAQELTPEQLAAYQDQKAHDEDLGESFIANRIGQVRGVGEALGVPTDALAGGVADLFGRGKETRDYLNNLKRYHGFESGYGELEGQLGAGLAGGELFGLEGLAGRATTAGGRIAQSAGGAAVRGGLENLIIGSTHDINETSLGNADLVGEKLYAEMPKHFLVGSAAGLVLGGAGSAIGEAASALKRPAAEMLDRGASAAIGREIGGGVEEGAALRSRMGRTPSSRTDVADFLSGEQSAYRGAAKAEWEAAKASAEAEVIAKRSAVEDVHTAQAWQQSAKAEAERIVSAKEAKAAVEAVESRHAAARSALEAEQAKATQALEDLQAERAATKSQLRNLAGDLDKVKGAELPSAENIIRSATEAFTPAQPSLTPPSPRAVALFNEWADTFGKRFSEPGKLTFSELQDVVKSLEKMEIRQRVVSGWGSDPEVSKAFESIKNAAKAEFDRASDMTASMVSEAKSLSASSLRARIPELDKAVGDAAEHVENIGGLVSDFERTAQQELRQAQREGFRTMKNQQRLSAEEERALNQRQRQELREIPKAQKPPRPDGKTPVDAQLKAVRSKGDDGAVHGASMLGAGLSLLHGNVAGAALSVLGGMAARTARAEGNVLAARVMSTLADSIAKADGQIARLAGRAVGRYARQGAEKAIEDDGPKRPKLTFEKAYQRVRDAQENPLILEQRVRASAGQWATQAPGVYSSLLSASMRAQQFLESKLPPMRNDPYSLTPHLENDDVSDTEKYDFTQYAKAVADPVGVLKDVASGTVTPQQVEALKAVYPSLYNQMRMEVQRQIAGLDEPLDYERSVNLGTLLEMDTNEVMTGEFQNLLSDMYSARAKDEDIAGGSKPRGVNSRLSKSTASAGQQMQQGDS